MKKLVCAFAGVVLFGTLAMADSPQLIDYQGYLKDGSGNPVTGSVNFTFRIYTASSGGTQKWTETQNSITVTGGLFSVTLGSVTVIPDTVFNQTDRWLGITVAGGSELTPRTRISSSAYAQRVQTIDGAWGGNVTGDIHAGRGNFGDWNSCSGAYAFVAGAQNLATGDYSSISGGNYNRARANFAHVGGGGGDNAADSNAANATYSTVTGGQANIATGGRAFVGGGKGNLATGNESVIGGGWYNYTQNSQSVVGGGYYNRATGFNSVVAGGQYDSASGDFSAVGGGSGNRSTGQHSAVAGGSGNRASGTFSTIPGGVNNLATGYSSFAAGNSATAGHGGAFVWADSGGTFSSSATNQFSVRSRGGVRIYTNSGLTAGVTMAAGASSWSSVSDSTKKRNIRLVDNSNILSRLMTLPIKQWSYKAQDESIEHIGPMAQDFYRIFKLGDDDKTISTIDPAGIALAAIQALNEKTDQLAAKTAEIDQLKQQLAELRATVEILAAKSSTTTSDKLAVANTPAGK